MIKIGNFELNESAEPYIIAEAGVNHNGNYDLAIRLIDEAVEAGAHAIKWQIYKAQTLCVKESPRFWSWEGEKDEKGTQYDSYSLLDKFPLDDYRKLALYCQEKGIEFMATPFDEEAIEFMESINVTSYKISSSDCTNIPLMKKIARLQKPIILSTGAATLGDIELAIDTIEGEGNSQIILLHCILKYPTDPQDANLKMITTLKNLFPKYVIGFSDHTLGTAVPLASVGFGAQVIEKHYTVDKTLPLSADHWLSVDPQELKELVNGSAAVKKAIGTSWARPIASEEPAKQNARRSIVSNGDIKKGDTITEEMLTAKRPGSGVHPKLMDMLVGSVAKEDIKDDSIISLKSFDLQ
ncbi:MAG: N-acetylneuraminate synthase family protein [Epsilonproteobacteria bacterium]|nr:N-acetylneuraminate synthase family protein [Campylobacterota bacterium]